MYKYLKNQRENIYSIETTIKKHKKHDKISDQKVRN
jgi:hypothetical protein